MAINFKASWEVSGKSASKMNLFTPALNSLSTFLQNSSYGLGITEINIILNCIGPIAGSPVPFKDFSTGNVFYKKFTKPQRRFEAKVKLNYKSLMKANQQSSFDIIASTILGVCDAMAMLKIDDLDLLSMRSDIFNKKFYSNQALVRPILPASGHIDLEKLLLSMPVVTDEYYWDLIEQSKKIPLNDSINQCNNLIANLCQKEEYIIIGFEIFLRRQIKRLQEVGIINIIEKNFSYMSDDEFLYFRCGVILQGAKTFSTLADRYVLNQEVDTEHSELLLNVADISFNCRLGENNNMIVPSEYGESIFDYNR